MVQKNDIKWLAVMATISLIVSCKVKDNDIPGVYVSNRPGYGDTIYVDRYHYFVHRKGSVKSLINRKGKWEYKTGNVYFKGFQLFEKDPYSDGTWITTPEMTRNGVIFPIDDNYYYRKINREKAQTE